MAISFIYHTPIQHLTTLKDSVRLISKYYRFNIDGFVSYLTTVTMLLTVLLILSVGSNYQIHTGKMLGLFGQCLVFLAGLVAATLPVTGFLYWYRSRKKRSQLFIHSP